jgi:sugar/nucleoside kinase (ribokinase family)
MSATKFERVTAGAEANVAVTISRLGLKSAYFSRFGNDQVGSVMLTLDKEILITGFKCTDVELRCGEIHALIVA